MSLQLVTVKQTQPTQVGKSPLPIRQSKAKQTELILTLDSISQLAIVTILPTFFTTYFHFEQAEGKEPIKILRNVNLESLDWCINIFGRRSVQAITTLLKEYNIEPTIGMSDWLGKMFDEMTIAYERDYKVSLSKSKRRVPW